MDKKPDHQIVEYHGDGFRHQYVTWEPLYTRADLLRWPLYRLSRWWERRQNRKLPKPRPIVYDVRLHDRVDSSGLAQLEGDETE